MSSSSFCAVCLSNGGGIFFGVPACRPCASFFRRSVRERREYVCRRLANDCPIDKEGMRNSCRACRLRRCFSAGMRAELAGKDEEEQSSVSMRKRRPNSVESETSPISPAASTSPPALDIPLTIRMAASLREQLECEKALCAQELGLSTVLGNKMHLLIWEEHMRIERGCVKFMLALVRQQFPAIDSVPVPKKLDILKDFCLHFGSLRFASMTVHAFPERTEYDCFVMHPGCVLHRDYVEQFNASATGAGKEQQTAMGRQYLNRFLHFLSHRYRPLDILPLEYAALAGIQFWTSVELAENLSSTAEGWPKDAFFAELNSICALHPSVQGNPRACAIRFGRLLSMLSEISTLSRDLLEFFTVSRVFLDPGRGYSFLDILEEMVNVGQNDNE